VLHHLLLAKVEACSIYNMLRVPPFHALLLLLAAEEG
jgi:hypothetical protein